MKMVQRFIVLSLLLLLGFVTTSPLTYANTNDLEVKKDHSIPHNLIPEKRVQAFNKIDEKINEHVQKEGKVVLNKVQEFEYTYEYEDGNTSTVSAKSILIREEDKDNISLDNAEISNILSYDPSPGDAVIRQIEVTIRDSISGSTYEQRLYTEFYFNYQTRGSMTKVIHSKPPKPQAGQFMVLVNGPTPWETIANDKNSARAGSDATWRLEVIGVPVVTVTQEAWVLCDINGNWRSGS